MNAALVLMTYEWGKLILNNCNNLVTIIIIINKLIKSLSFVFVRILFLWGIFWHYSIKNSFYSNYYDKYHAEKTTYLL